MRARPTAPCSRCLKPTDLGFEGEAPGLCGYCSDLAREIRMQARRIAACPPVESQRAEAERRNAKASKEKEWLERWEVCATCRELYLRVDRDGRPVGVGPERPANRCAGCHSVVECLVQFSERKKRWGLAAALGEKPAF